MSNANWVAMLDRVRDALEQTALESARHEAALGEAGGAEDQPSARRAELEAALIRVNESQRLGQTRGDLADQAAARAIADLDEPEAELKSYLERLDGLRKALAAGAERLQ
jgi:hypothetical protein